VERTKTDTCKRPVIGICTAFEKAQWSFWNQTAAVVPSNYIEAVRAAGGFAVLLAPEELSVAAAAEVILRLDGLMLIGGCDIEPESYDQQPHSQTVDCVPLRDSFEAKLLTQCLDADKPLLAICRGMQLMNVAFGGTLYQHLPESHGHSEHCRVPGSFDEADHTVTLSQGSLVAQSAGGSVHTVKSHHHQGVDEIGEGLQVTGRSNLNNDELVEALEVPGKRFALGVQWHPEADSKSPFIRKFVEACARDRVKE